MNTISMSRSVLALTLAAALACGGSDSTDPGGGDGTGTGGNGGGSNNSATCTVTLTGAETGSPACPHVTADQTDNNDKASFGFQAADGTDTVRVAITFSGAPTATTYDAASGSEAILLLNNATTLWTTDTSAGSWSLTFSSVKETSSGADITAYEVHGTFTGTVVPAITETTIGPVTINATF
jgi:hypothetical protein